MWLDWIVMQYCKRALDRKQPEKIVVMMRDKTGREFPPFDIEWKDNVLFLCENVNDA